MSDYDNLPDLSVSEPAGFNEIAQLIRSARERTLSAVNSSLIELYWEIGRMLSARITSDGWGKGTVEQLAIYIQKQHPSLRGFTRANLFRMRKFYETWLANEKVATLLRQLPWSSHLHIMAKTKRPEEQEFYLRMAIQQRWPVREVARQIDSALFERAVLNPPKLSTALRELHPGAESLFRDAYVVEFLNLPDDHRETDLHQGLLNNLRQFLCEIGRDFCFIGSEVPLQVGVRDFALDLLFFHRELNCLVAIELKIGEFQPEHLGKLEFYLEALDRDLRKPHEGPSIGVLLCASKDSEVVEYALSRTLSPALIAEYQTRLPDRDLLQAKLHEFYALSRRDEPKNPNEQEAP